MPLVPLLLRGRREAPGPRSEERLAAPDLRDSRASDPARSRLRPVCQSFLAGEHRASPDQRGGDRVAPATAASHALDPRQARDRRASWAGRVLHRLPRSRVRAVEPLNPQMPTHFDAFPSELTDHFRRFDGCTLEWITFNSF